MKTQRRSPAHSDRAFSRIELVVVVALLGLLTTLFVRAQALEESRARRDRVICVFNLKRIGLAFRMWSNDHEYKFPMQSDAKNGGTLDAIEKQEAWRHFLVLSNELSDPKVLVCPADSRTGVTNFLNLTVTNVSYFIGIDATELLPRTLLSGDRNVTNGTAPMKGVLEVAGDPPAGWTERIHNEGGNICLADGSVMQTTTPLLRKEITAANASLKLGRTRLQLPEPAPFEALG